MARVKSVLLIAPPPALIIFHDVYPGYSEGSCTGLLRFSVVPSPTVEFELSPQAYNNPVVVTAKDVLPAVPTALQENGCVVVLVIEAATCIGLDLLIVVPSPNSPSVLYPHIYSLPVGLTAPLL